MKIRFMKQEREKYVRPSWDEYFIKLSQMVGSRGTCDRGRSGCVIVRDKRVIATGYVGSPPGLPHCDEEGHLMHVITKEDGTVSKHCVRTIHAEQNAICQAAKYGISLEGATIYVKMEPCYVCARMIVAIGIKRVVCEKRYHAAQMTSNLFNQAGVEMNIIDDNLEEYEDQ